MRAFVFVLAVVVGLVSHAAAPTPAARVAPASTSSVFHVASVSTRTLAAETPIEVVFSRPLARVAHEVVEDDPAGPLHRVPVQLSRDGARVTIRPLERWQGGSAVRVRLAATSAGGERLVHEGRFVCVAGAAPTPALEVPELEAPLDSGPFRVVASSPDHDAPVAPLAVAIAFSAPVDTATVGVRASRALDASWPTPALLLLAPRERVFEPGAEVTIALGPGVRDASGRALEPFELRFVPRSVPCPASPPDASAFAPDWRAEVWHVDLDARAAELAEDLRARGLACGDSSIDDLVRARLEGAVLAALARLYEGLPVSFTARAPGNGCAPGFTHSRIAIGGRPPAGVNLFGQAVVDAGNREREDMARDPGLGVFASMIAHPRCRLEEALATADARFLDGTYALGDGSPAEDLRFRQVRDAIETLGRALGAVTAHEVAHALGCAHDPHALSLMHGGGTPEALLVDPRLAFSARSRAVLTANLRR